MICGLACALLLASGAPVESKPDRSKNPSRVRFNSGFPFPGIRAGTVTVGDLVFDTLEAGPADGELVILLHGFPQTNYEWRHQLVALGRAGYFVVAPNQRGISPGARLPNVEDYRIDLLAEDVLGIADALGRETFHLVGHDWGAVVAWWVAGGEASNRLKTLNTLSVPHLDALDAELADTESCQYEASDYVDTFTLPAPLPEDALLTPDEDGVTRLELLYAALSPNTIDAYVKTLGSEETLGAGLNWYRANIANRRVIFPNEDGELGIIDVPTLFFFSTADTAFCSEGANATEGYVTGPYSFEEVVGINHWLPELAHELVSEKLIAHFQSVN